MTHVTFITGNQNKADYLAKYLGMNIEHKKLDLDELQSLDLRTIVEHKVRSDSVASAGRRCILRIFCAWQIPWASYPIFTRGSR